MAWFKLDTARGFVQVVAQFKQAAHMVQRHNIQSKQLGLLHSLTIPTFGVQRARIPRQWPHRRMCMNSLFSMKYLSPNSLGPGSGDLYPDLKL